MAAEGSLPQNQVWATWYDLAKVRFSRQPTFGGKLPRDVFIRQRRSAGRRHHAGASTFPSKPGILAPARRMQAALAATGSMSMILISAIWISALGLPFLLAAPPAFAGPNAGGVLLLHCNQTLQFSTGGDFSEYAELYDAKNAVTQVPGDGQGVVYYVIAAFDDFAMPRLKTTSFGIELSSPEFEPVLWGVTGETNVVLTVGSWPSSGSGIAISWTEPFNRRINEICWFCGYAGAGQTVKLVRCPGQPGTLDDDSFPAEVDEIAGYGMLGFGVSGFNPLSDGAATGACCSGSGRCILQTESGCQAWSGYNYTGDNTICSPNPCTPGVGACCIRAECRMLLWDECLDARGLFQSEGVGCNPTPCDFARVETTWGALKSTYRR